MESAAARALANTDITLQHPNVVPQVMNEASSVSDDSYDDNFYENGILFCYYQQDQENQDTSQL